MCVIYLPALKLYSHLALWLFTAPKNRDGWEASHHSYFWLQQQNPITATVQIIFLVLLTPNLHTGGWCNNGIFPLARFISVWLNLAFVVFSLAFIQSHYWCSQPCNYFPYDRGAFVHTVPAYVWYEYDFVNLNWATNDTSRPCAKTAFVIYILAFTWSCYFQSQACNYVPLAYSRASALINPWSYKYNFRSSDFSLQSRLHPSLLLLPPILYFSWDYFRIRCCRFVQCMIRHHYTLLTWLFSFLIGPSSNPLTHTPTFVISQVTVPELLFKHPE